MRNIYFTLLGLAIAFGSTAQEIYDTFDDIRTVRYGLDVPFPEQQNNGLNGTVWPGWHGTLLQYTNNPGTNDVNSSPLCAFYDRNPSELYDVVLINCGELADLAPYLSGEKSISMDVFAPVPGITIQFSLQNAELALGGYPAGRHSEYQAVTTTGGEWETLEFILTNEPWQDPANSGWWPDATTANNDVDEMVLLFNPGVNVQETFYFDNLNGPERATAPCPESNIDDFMLADADCEHSLYPTFMHGRMVIYPDPDPTQDDNCLEYARNGGQQFDALVGKFDQALTFTETSTFSIDIWDPAPPSQIYFGFQDQFQTPFYDAECITSTALEWTTFTFDLSFLEGNGGITDWVISTDPDQEVAKTFYFDNLKLENVISVGEESAVAVKAYPNPTTGLVTLENVASFDAYQVFSVDGRLVDAGAINTNTTQIDLNAFNAGVYNVVLAGDNLPSNSIRVIVE